MAKTEKTDKQRALEPPKLGKEGERTEPDLVDDFGELLVKYGVSENRASVIVQYIKDTGSVAVIERPMELLNKLAMFPSWVPPITRRTVLDHWMALRKIPTPEGYEEEAEKPAEEVRAKAKGSEKEEAKFSVDPATGNMRAATTTDKTALTWDEAEKLSQNIAAKNEEQQRKAAASAKREVSYVYDDETGQVRMAKDNETGGTLDQAKELKKMADASKKPPEEAPFILDADGNWTLNPNRQPTYIEQLAYETMRRSREQGQPIDPLEALAQTAEKVKMYQEVFGGSKNQAEWLSDPVKFFEMMQTLQGGGKGDEEVRKELAELRTTLQQMQETQHREEIVGLRTLISSQNERISELTNVVTELKKPVVGMTTVDLIHELGAKGIDELSGLRKDIKATVSEAMTGSKLPPRKTEEQRGQQVSRLRQGVETDKEIQELGEGLGFLQD